MTNELAVLARRRPSVVACVELWRPYCTQHAASMVAVGSVQRRMLTAMDATIGGVALLLLLLLAVAAGCYRRQRGKRRHEATSKHSAGKITSPDADDDASSLLSELCMKCNMRQCECKVILYRQTPNCKRQTVTSQRGNSTPTPPMRSRSHLSDHTQQRRRE